MAAQKMDVPVEARELQRRYAASVFRLRGYLDNTISWEAPPEDKFKLKTYYVEDFDKRVDVVATYNASPLLAYIGESQPLDLHVTYNDDGSVTPAVSIPRDAAITCGHVTLVWPTATIQSEKPLKMRRPSRILMLDPATLDQTGATFAVRWTYDKPLEIRIGAAEIETDYWKWDGNRLEISAPKGTPPGPLVIVSDKLVATSTSNVDPSAANAKQQSGASSAK